MGANAAVKRLARRIKNRKLPGLNIPTTGQEEVDRALLQIREYLQMYEGDQNAPKERFVTLDELERSGLLNTITQQGFATIDKVLGKKVAGVFSDNPQAQKITIIEPPTGGTGTGGLAQVFDDKTPGLGGPLEGNGFNIQDIAKFTGGSTTFEYTGTVTFDVPNVNFKSATLATDNDTADEPGWKGTPQNSISDDYELVLTDAAKQIYLSAGASKTLTIPANSSVAFPIGTIIPVINDSGNNWTIAITTDTLEKYGGATGSQTLGDNHKGLLEKVTATSWKYSSTD